MTAHDLWAVLAGEHGYLAFTFPDGATFCPVDQPRTFCRHCDVLAYEPGDLAVGAVPFRDPDFSRVGYSNVLWIQADTGKETARLERFGPEPTLILRWGVKAVGLWALSEGLSPVWTERLNKRLAHELGAKKKHAGLWFRFPPAGTVLRSGRPQVVENGGGSGGLYGAREVAGGLPDAPDPAEAFKRHLANL